MEWRIFLMRLRYQFLNLAVNLRRRRKPVECRAIWHDAAQSCVPRQAGIGYNGTRDDINGRTECHANRDFSLNSYNNNQLLASRIMHEICRRTYRHIAC